MVQLSKVIPIAVVPNAKENATRDDVVDSVVAELEDKLFPPQTFVRTFTYSLKKIRTMAALFVLLTSVGVATWRAVRQKTLDEEAERTRFHSTALDVGETLRRQLESSASSVFALASMVEVDGGVFLESHFTEVAGTILMRYRGISNFDIAPYAVVKTKVPLAGNEGAIGHAMLSDYRRIDATLRTIRAKAVQLDGPLKLLQGGSAVIARYPVFTKFSPKFIPNITSWWNGNWSHPCCNATQILPLPGFDAESLPGDPDADGNPTYFYGLIEFVSKIDKLVEDLNLDKVEQQMQYQLANNNKHPSMAHSVFYHSADAPPGAILDDPVIIPVSLPQLKINWEFRAVPKTGWQGPSTFFIVAMISVYGGLLVSLVSSFLMEWKALQIVEAHRLLKIRAEQVKDTIKASAS